MVVSVEVLEKSAVELAGQSPEMAGRISRLIAEEKSEEALALAEEALQQSPEDATVWNAYGLAQKNLLHWAKAREAFYKAIQLDNSSAKYRANLALLCGKHAEFEAEEEWLLSALQHAPDFFQAWVNLAQNYRRRNQIDQAISAYHKALCLQNDHPGIRFSLAQLYAEQAAWQEVVTILSPLLEQGSYSTKMLSLFSDAFERLKGRDAVLPMLETLASAKNLGDSKKRALARAYLRLGQRDRAVQLYQLVAEQSQTVESCLDIAAFYKKIGDIGLAGEWVNRVLSNDPAHAEAWALCAELYLLQDNPAALVQAYLEMTEAKPNIEVGKAGNAVGLKLFHACHYEEALTVYQRVALRSQGKVQAKAKEAIGMIFLTNGQYTSAQSFLIEACQGDASLVHAPVQLSHCFEKISLHDRARALLKDTLEKHPDNVTVMSALMGHYLTNSRNAEAEAVCARAARVAPTDPVVISMRAALLERQKKFQEAYDLFKSLPPLYTERLDVILPYATVCFRLGKKQEAITLLEEGIARETTPPHSKASLRYRLGEYYDKMGEYDKAFAAFKQGADWRFGSEKELQINHFNTMVDRYIRYFDHETLGRLPKSSIITSAPIFIVGMPRSGTTLTEQILASHSQIYGAGELMYIPNIVRNLPGRIGNGQHYPYVLDDVSQETLDFAARRYMEEMQKRMQPGERYCIDKMPHNFLQLGLISLLFPEAKIIHCRRNPLDNCLSCYFQEFSSGHEYSYNLEVTGRHYQAYHRIMQHWKSLNILPMLDVQYETLVADPEPVVREMLAFIGVEWEDGVLDFHRSKRMVATASYDQVRQPLYTRSSGRWRHYAQYLGPLRKGLGPLAEVAEVDD